MQQIDKQTIEAVAEAIFIARNGERNRIRFKEQKAPYMGDAQAALAYLREQGILTTNDKE